MHILNPAICDDLEHSRGLRLNLGAGLRHRDGFYSVDKVSLPGVDIVADLDELLTYLPDNSVEAIYSRHTLEHVPDFLTILAEMHRVMRASGTLEILVPHFSNPYGYSDPTHLRFFGLYSFFYFCDSQHQPARKVPNFYIPERFSVEKITIRLPRGSWFDKVLRHVLQPIINWKFTTQDFYERWICRWIPADDMHFLLEPQKSVAFCELDNSEAA